MKNIFLTLTILLFFGTAAPLHATPPAPPPLPAGMIHSRSGELVAVEAIGTEKGVVLLLLKNVSSGGEKLLAFVESLETPLPADRLLIVAGGVDEKLLNTMATRHTNLGASWYRDTDDLLAKGLALKANPVIMGIRDGRVIWTTFGMADPKLLEKTMRGWLSR